MILNPAQIEELHSYIAENAVISPELYDDILDHMASLIESKMQGGMNYESALRECKAIFPPCELLQLQNETIFLLTYKKHVQMIRFIFISGYLSLSLFVLAWVCHQGLGGIFISGQLATLIYGTCTLTSGTIFCFAFLPALFLYGYRKFINNLSEVSV